MKNRNSPDSQRQWNSTKTTFTDNFMRCIHDIKLKYIPLLKNFHTLSILGRPNFILWTKNDCDIEETK